MSCLHNLDVSVQGGVDGVILSSSGMANEKKYEFQFKGQICKLNMYVLAYFSMKSYTHTAEYSVAIS